MDGDVRDLDDRSGAELAAAEQAEINAEEQTSSWEQREARLAHRERLADERERLADARERAADVRERTADEREGLADDRERAADQREYLADQREQRLNDLEARLDARARSAGVSTETVPERVMEAITRGRSLLAASSANLDRSEAAVERQRVHHQRQQEAVEREIVAAGRAFASPMTEPTPPQVDRADLLRRRFLALAAEIVNPRSRSPTCTSVLLPTTPPSVPGTSRSRRRRGTPPATRVRPRSI